MITNKTDIYLISEFKSFSNQQFKLQRSEIFRLERDEYGGGILYFM